MRARDINKIGRFTKVIKDAKVEIPGDYSERIKALRGRLGMTQEILANKLAVSFATVNRWENKQAKPSPLSWRQIEKLYHGQLDENEESRNSQTSTKTRRATRLDSPR